MREGYVCERERRVRGNVVSWAREREWVEGEWV